MLIRIIATGQVIDMIDVAALAKIDAGMAVRVEERETAAVNRAIETGAKFLKETFRKPAQATPSRREPNQVRKDIEDDAEMFTGRRPRRSVHNVIDVTPR